VSAEASEPDRLPGAPHPRESAALFGQEAAEAEFLAAAASGRLHHGWLISGPRGTGKATLAWRIARHLLAGGAGATLAMPPEHPVFRQLAALAAPQLFLCRRSWDEKARRARTAIGVEEVRELKAFFQLSAAEGGWRVAIVDSADEMTPQAANALLKILEEPPARAVLLLVSHQPAWLLPTIRSRCRPLACRRLDRQDLGRALDAAGLKAGDGLAMLAELADGSVGEAIRLAAADGPALYDAVSNLLAAGPPLPRPEMLALAEAASGREAELRYDLTLGLTRLALARLARRAAGLDLTPVSPAEAEAMSRLARGVAQARLWADLAARIEARTAHARAVHLDPAQVILDTYLQIDAAAVEARALAV
jgi:DNA polymerase III subunit delta'